MCASIPSCDVRKTSCPVLTAVERAPLALMPRWSSHSCDLARMEPKLTSTISAVLLHLKNRRNLDPERTKSRSELCLPTPRITSCRIYQPRWHKRHEFGGGERSETSESLHVAAQVRIACLHQSINPSFLFMIRHHHLIIRRYRQVRIFCLRQSVNSTKTFLNAGGGESISDAVVLKSHCSKSLYQQRVSNIDRILPR